MSQLGGIDSQKEKSFFLPPRGAYGLLGRAILLRKIIERCLGTEPSVLLNKKNAPWGAFLFGGEGGIRTHEGRKSLPVFKTGAFNRSATSPNKLRRI